MEFLGGLGGNVFGWEEEEEERCRCWSSECGRSSREDVQVRQATP